MHLNAHDGVQSVLSVEARSLRVSKERHIKCVSHVDFRGVYRSVKVEKRQLTSKALVSTTWSCCQACVPMTSASPSEVSTATVSPLDTDADASREHRMIAPETLTFTVPSPFTAVTTPVRNLTASSPPGSGMSFLSNAV